MRICVVGCGGVGGYFGGLLAKAGYDVLFLMRAGAHFDQLCATSKLRVTANAMESFEVDCKAETSAASIGPCDMVIVSVKAYVLDALAPTLQVSARTYISTSALHDHGCGRRRRPQTHEPPSTDLPRAVVRVPSSRASAIAASRWSDGGHPIAKWHGGAQHIGSGPG